MGQIVSKVEAYEPPRAGKVCALALLSYLFVTVGIAYDIIQEPPSIGGEQDPVTGQIKPVTFMPYRINGQYIMEGLAGGMMYSVGGLGLILLSVAHQKDMATKYKKLVLGIAGGMIVGAYLCTMMFLRIKMPSYLTSNYDDW